MLKSRSVLAIAIVLFLASAELGQNIKPPKLAPSPQTDKHRDLLAEAVRLKENKGKSEIKLFIDNLSSQLAIISESTSEQKSSGFAWDYYRPYFCGITNRKFAEPFAYYIAQSAGSDEVERWLTLNAERVHEFLTWSKNYQWPKPKI